MLERVHHHYEALEEFHAGMWRIVRGEVRKGYIARAAELMRDVQRFEEAMQAAVENWPVSCEHNLTCLDSNRIAWLGHAGCCYATNSPEEATRCGWHTLTPAEQDAANAAAARVLARWGSAYRPSKGQLVLI